MTDKIKVNSTLDTVVYLKLKQLSDSYNSKVSTMTNEILKAVLKHQLEIEHLEDILTEGCRINEIRKDAKRILDEVNLDEF